MLVNRGDGTVGAEQDHGTNRLVGWKEIATHLGKSVRAVQRWERELGLPVHRIKTAAGSSVWARRSELDAWLAAQAVKPPAESARSWPWLAVALAALAVIAAVTAALLTVRRASDSPQPARFRTAGNAFEALDDSGAVLWRHTFPRRLVPVHFAAGRPQVAEPRLADLDGDGTPEVLALLALEPLPDGRTEPETLYCWSADGKTRWTYTPQGELAFEGGMQFGPEWMFAEYVISPDQPRTIFVSATDGTWWASFIDAIDAAGASRRIFVHGGIPYALAVVGAEGRRRLFAGTVSNEHHSAGLAVIDADGPPGRWPQEPSPFRCAECPTGAPLRYVLLPPSDLIAAERAPYNRPLWIETRGDLIQVHTQEVLDTRFQYPTRVYRMTRHGEPLGYAVGDGFDKAHARLEALGQLDHPAAECPDMTASLQTRMWTPASGWQEITIPRDPVSLTPAR